jgi:hypothetical protein
LNGVYFPIEYVFNLGNGIVVSPDTVYWLAITNDAGPVHGWLWARAFGQYDQLTAATFDGIATGPWNVYGSGGMYFELNDQFIPEPTAFELFLTVFLGAASVRRLYA